MQLSKEHFSVELSPIDKIGQVAAIALAFAIPISTTLTTIMASIVLMAWGFGGNWQQKKEILCHHPVTKWMYPLIILTFIGITYSSGDGKSIYRSLFDSCRLLFIPVLIYFFQDKKVARLALWSFVGAMGITLVLAFLKIYAGFPIGLKYPAGAIFKSHIKTSFFMAMAAFFLAFELKQIQSHRFLIFLVVIAMAYYLLFMSVGRIGYITFVLCLCFLAWHWYRLKGLMLASVIALVTIGTAYLVSDLFADRINLLAQDLDLYHQGGRLLESSLGSRIQFAKTSSALISERPFWGWGTGSFAEAYATMHQGEETLLTDNPHNEFLRVGVELGGAGLILLIMLFLWQWRLSKYLPKETQGLCRGILLAFIVGCLINSWLKDFTEGYFYCLMMAVFFSALPIAKKSPKLSFST
jgi:O-antigen ligase